MLIINQLISALCITLSLCIKLTLEQYLSQQEYHVPRGTYFSIICNTTDLLRLEPRSGPTDAGIGYSLLPVDDAELPVGWSFLVTNSQTQVIITGLQEDPDLNFTELELARTDLESSETYKSLITLTYYGSDVSTGVDSNELLELRFSFNNISLEDFLLRGLQANVETLLREVVWPNSRLVQVERFGEKNVAIYARNEATTRNKATLDMLRMEVNLATRNGTQLKLCQSKRSKALSIEHYFRALGLFPNWCSLKTRHLRGT